MTGKDRFTLYFTDLTILQSPDAFKYFLYCRWTITEIIRVVGHMDAVPKNQTYSLVHT